MKIQVEHHNQFGKWNHYQTKYNEADAYRVANSKANQTGKRHLMGDGGAGFSGSTIKICAKR